jgi:hypothetical protein
VHVIRFDVTGGTGFEQLYDPGPEICDTNNKLAFAHGHPFPRKTMSVFALIVLVVPQPSSELVTFIVWIGKIKFCESDGGEKAVVTQKV